MTTDPEPMGPTLQQHLRRVAELAPGGMPLPDLLPPLPELAELAQQGRAEQRTELWRTRIPSRFLWARCEDFTDPVGPELAAWGADPAGRNLVLVGATGVGKSHAAVAAARVRWDRGCDVAFWPTVELLDALRPGGPEGLLAELCQVEVLVLDDLGAEKPTDWTAERLYALINRRWLEERTTVATTNVAPDGLEPVLGSRTYSRLVGSGAVALALSGADRRLAKQ